MPPSRATINLLLTTHCTLNSPMTRGRCFRNLDSLKIKCMTTTCISWVGNYIDLAIGSDKELVFRYVLFCLCRLEKSPEKRKFSFHWKTLLCVCE